LSYNPLGFTDSSYDYLTFPNIKYISCITCTSCCTLSSRRSLSFTPLIFSWVCSIFLVKYTNHTLDTSASLHHLHLRFLSSYVRPIYQSLLSSSHVLYSCSRVISSLCHHSSIFALTIFSTISEVSSIGDDNPSSIRLHLLYTRSHVSYLEMSILSYPCSFDTFTLTHGCFILNIAL
jgi:hypothetical protein